MTRFSPGQTVTLWRNGGITNLVLGLWDEKDDVINGVMNLSSEEREIRGLLLASALGSLVIVMALLIITVFAATDDTIWRRGVYLSLIVAGICGLWLLGVGIVLALRVKRSMRFKHNTGSFGYEYATLITALSGDETNWYDETWTAAKVAQGTTALLEGRAREVLHKRAEVLRNAEAHQRATPDSAVHAHTVEQQRAAFKESYRVFARFKLVDKELGWTPFFPKEGTAVSAA